MVATCYGKYYNVIQYYYRSPFSFLLSSGPFGSSMLRWHPFFFPVQFLLEDYWFRITCCQTDGAACSLYYSRRPPNFCFGYVPPWWGTYVKFDSHALQSTRVALTHLISGRHALFQEYYKLASFLHNFGRHSPKNNTNSPHFCIPLVDTIPRIL